MALPPGWESGWAPQHGVYYYFNTALGITQWERPSIATVKPAASSLVSSDYDGDSDGEPGTVRPSDRRTEDRDPQWAASVALARKLDQEAQGARKRRKQTGHLWQAEELRRHLYDPTAAAAAAPVPAARAPGLSYAKAAEKAVGVPATTGSGTNNPTGPQTPRITGAPSSHLVGRSRLLSSQKAKSRIAPGRQQEALWMLVDGANVAFKYGEANGRAGRFCARGIRLAVEYLCARLQLPEASIAVIMNENRWDSTDVDLVSLEERGLVSWTPTAKDDDVFLLTAAADHGAWVVTNDRWTDHRAARHATEAVRARTLRFGWIREVFAPAADDVGRFNRAACDRCK